MYDFIAQTLSRQSDRRLATELEHRRVALELMSEVEVFAPTIDLMTSVESAELTVELAQRRADADALVERHGSRLAAIVATGRRSTAQPSSERLPSRLTPAR